MADAVQEHPGGGPSGQSAGRRTLSSAAEARWIEGLTGAVVPTDGAAGVPMGVDEAAPSVPAARPAVPAPVVAPRAGAPYYQEDQVALGARRGGLGNTCPSHALNAAMAGPVSNYEHQVAVTIGEFDEMVATAGLPPLAWRDFGGDFTLPPDIDNLIGPRRAIVQLSRPDPVNGGYAAHFFALRGDGEENAWRAIDSMRPYDQPIVDTTLFGALNQYLAEPNVQMRVGTWRPGTVLPEVRQPEPAVVSTKTAMALATAIASRDAGAINAMVADVDDAQWRLHADAILALLPSASADQRANLADLVGVALFEGEGHEGRTLTAEDRTPEQLGRMLACLMYGSLADTTIDLNEERLAPILQLFRNLDRTPGNVTRETAQTFLRQLYPDIDRLDITRLGGEPGGAVRSAWGGPWSDGGEWRSAGAGRGPASGASGHRARRHR